MKREARKDWTLTDTAGSNCCIRTALPLAVEVACLHIPAAAPLPNDPATFADDERNLEHVNTIKVHSRLVQRVGFGIVMTWGKGANIPLISHFC